MGQEQELKHWPINWQSKNNTLYQVLFNSSVSRVQADDDHGQQTSVTTCISFSVSPFTICVEHVLQKEVISFVAPQNQLEACCVIDMEIMLCNTLRSRREKQFIL